MTRTQAIKKMHRLANKMHALNMHMSSLYLKEIYDLAYEFEVEVNEKYEDVNGEETCVGIYIEDDWYLLPQYVLDPIEGTFSWRYVEF